MKLTGDELFDRQMQDKMGLKLAHNAGLGQYLAVKLSARDMATRLSGVWAGLPEDERNLSHYRGVGANATKAGISHDIVVDSLEITKQKVAG